ncbi:hypothetical protein [Pelosinus sp. sgz500959]|uniref:hypothetical protein n=1 Tax=Pelosinus sp. sgz500959 TaxID=3242472 RepID=UPI00366B2181
MKNKIVCHANECIFNNQGGCSNDFGVTIAVYDGVAVCPNHTPMSADDAKKLELIEGLYQVLEGLLLEDHGDRMSENIRDYDLCTSNENTVFMELDGGDHLQDICTDNDRVVAIVDTLNVLKYGRVMRVTECS